MQQRERASLGRARHLLATSLFEQVMTASALLHGLGTFTQDVLLRRFSARPASKPFTM